MINRQTAARMRLAREKKAATKRQRNMRNKEEYTDYPELEKARRVGLYRRKVGAPLDAPDLRTKVGRSLKAQASANNV